MLNDVQKARQCAVTLVPPANLICGQVLMEQEAEGATELEDILKAYVAQRMGDHGQRAACRQLEGLQSVVKPNRPNSTCFEREMLFPQPTTWSIGYQGQKLP